MRDDQKLELAENVIKYCRKFNISLEYLFAILEDQKVTPMIRGKAMEYNAFILLDAGLPKSVWSVQKLNLNAQPGITDEDISVTHRRTGVILKVESKSAVRGSFSLGRRAKILRVPHFKVKSHRSRSNIKLAGTSNDRYSVDCFDVLITNTSNSIFQNNTVSEHLEIKNDIHIKNMLYEFYEVQSDLDLIRKCESDWRFCIPTDIAVDGFIPRTPYVKLNDDNNWRPIAEIEQRLTEIVNERRNSNRATRRS